MEVEIGLGKTARRAYGLDDIAIVPSRRTRDTDDVDIGWELEGHRFELPLMASAMDAAVDVDMAVAIGKLGGLAVLNLEGLQTRYADPGPVYEEIASLPPAEATRGIQRVYQEPIKEELIARRIARDQGRGAPGRRLPYSPAGGGVLQARPGGWPGHPGDPGDGDQRGARLLQDRAAQPEEVHRRAAHPGGGGRLRLLLHRPAPDAHRRGGRAGGRGPGRGLHHPGRVWASGCRRPPPWPTPRPRGCAISWRRAAT